MQIHSINELSSLNIGESTEINEVSKIDDSINTEETYKLEEIIKERETSKLQLVKIEAEDNISSNVISFETKKILNNNNRVTFDDVGGLS